jgi:membrane-bound ClpP family serine protease
VPGVGIVGLFGFIAMGFGIYGSYQIGLMEGNLTLAGCILSSGGLTWLAFRPGTWKRVSVNSNILGKVNLIKEDTIKVGDEGLSTTRINPYGNARFQNEYFEVTSQRDFIDEGTPIKVIKIVGSQIIVQPLKK